MGLRRELREEIGVEAAPTDCRLVLVLHSAPEYADDSESFNLFLAVERWAGGRRSASRTSAASWSGRRSDGLAAVAHGEAFLARRLVVRHRLRQRTKRQRIGLAGQTDGGHAPLSSALRL